MYPLCIALMAACLARPMYVVPPMIAVRPAQPRYVYMRPPPPPEMAPDDPRIAPAPTQYFTPAPDRVWAKSKKYVCPASAKYGQGRGVYLTEADATASGFRPVGGRACFRAEAARPQHRSPG